MINYIIGGIIILILALSIGYIVKAKKSGVHCIGCPSAGKCSGGCSCNTPTKNTNNVYDELCDFDSYKI